MEIVLFIFLEFIFFQMIYTGVKGLRNKEASNQRKFWAVFLIVGGLVFAMKHIMELSYVQ